MLAELSLLTSKTDRLAACYRSVDTLKVWHHGPNLKTQLTCTKIYKLFSNFGIILGILGRPARFNFRKPSVLCDIFKDKVMLYIFNFVYHGTYVSIATFSYGVSPSGI